MISATAAVLQAETKISRLRIDFRYRLVPAMFLVSPVVPNLSRPRIPLSARPGHARWLRPPLLTQIRSGLAPSRLRPEPFPPSPRYHLRTKSPWSSSAASATSAPGSARRALPCRLQAALSGAVPSPGRQVPQLVASSPLQQHQFAKPQQPLLLCAPVFDASSPSPASPPPEVAPSLAGVTATVVVVRGQHLASISNQGPMFPGPAAR